VRLAHGAATGAETAPAHLLGYLGLIPLTLGLVGLVRLASGTTGEAEAPEVVARGILPVSGIMLANSGDTLAVFTSLFADTAEGLEIWVLATTVASAAAYAVLARWLVARAGVVRGLKRYSRVALPFLLVGIGVYILANTGTDAIP
jgi:cadmium resistance protein CadD (predicted permease)